VLTGTTKLMTVCAGRQCVESNRSISRNKLSYRGCIYLEIKDEVESLGDGNEPQWGSIAQQLRMMVQFIQKARYGIGWV